MFHKYFMTVLFLLATPAVAADFAAGGEAYKRGDYETAAREFLPLAEKGDHRAMYALGSMYSVGHGVPQDLNEAFRWFREAARYGRPDAQYKLGLMYAEGLGVAQDYRKAINWFGKSAKKGYRDAQYRIGRMYLEGHGVTQNYIKAYAWSYVALAQGVTDAKTTLDETKENLNAEQLKEADALAESYQSRYTSR